MSMYNHAHNIHTVWVLHWIMLVFEQANIVMHTQNTIILDYVLTLTGQRVVWYNTHWVVCQGICSYCCCTPALHQ